ncbi:U7 snRNA-associated Sm-like protein LSm10 isoform X1 [Diorhabda sublineata]|uniref:U7 snRNA-associated Sm-like protein LSm10 isoform X1 n=1 Tax=Diorhabda sublineata TaxID=1163346 RepID=UPI0024E0691C|nr:U7 snRNA-associated Sm-like protein LSm10 isoform X1 [Diorhabda sublineata]
MSANLLQVLGSKKEQFLIYNTLSSLVKALEGYYTTIDLRNESSVSGLVTKVDGFMNVEMEDVVYIDSTGISHFFNQFFVRHRNIRYVHIPEELSPNQIMQEQISGMKKPRIINKKRTFKQLRAQRYQKETLRSLNK